MSEPTVTAVTPAARRTLAVAVVLEVAWLLFLGWMVVRGG